VHAARSVVLELDCLAVLTVQLAVSCGLDDRSIVELEGGRGGRGCIWLLAPSTQVEFNF
jgi:hypothetical protein